MFRRSDSQSTFGSLAVLLSPKKRAYLEAKHWSGAFRRKALPVLLRNEPVFAPLFCADNGRTNKPVAQQDSEGHRIVEPALIDVDIELSGVFHLLAICAENDVADVQPSEIRRRPWHDVGHNHALVPRQVKGGGHPWRDGLRSDADHAPARRLRTTTRADGRV